MLLKVCKPLTAMSLLSVVVFIIILLLTTVKSDTQNKKTSTPPSTAMTFKEFMTNMINEQSLKIQSLLKKVQTNAQVVLTKIESMKQNLKFNKQYPKKVLSTDIHREIETGEHQLESPLLQNSEETASNGENFQSRSFTTHYASPTGYGVSGNANYGAGTPTTSTYHHHSIGFDPINIVVSVSLLSFLLQALQGLLTRTRLPTPVVEAKSLNAVEDWVKKYEDSFPLKVEKYLKNKYPKKYLQ